MKDKHCVHEFSMEVSLSTVSSTSTKDLLALYQNLKIESFLCGGRIHTKLSVNLEPQSAKVLDQRGEGGAGDSSATSKVAETVDGSVW